MALEEEVAKGLATNWYLVLGGWWLYRWARTEKTERQAAERERREEERKEAEMQRKSIQTAVREELVQYQRDATQELARFRDDLRRELEGLNALVRQHDSRLAIIEERTKVTS